MPDAHSGFGMPIGGVLFTSARSCRTRSASTSGAASGRATDLVWRTASRPRSCAPSCARSARRADRDSIHKPAPVDPATGCRDHGHRACRARSSAAGSRATVKPRHARLGEPLPRGPARRGGPGLRHAPLGLAEPGQADLRRVPQARARRLQPPWPRAAATRARVPAARRRHRSRRLLGGDDVRAAVRRGEPEPDARRGRGGVPPHARIHRFERVVDVHHNYAAPGSTRRPTGSSTARARSGPAPATWCSSRARWARRRTSPRASATVRRSRRASTAPGAR